MNSTMLNLSLTVSTPASARAARGNKRKAPGSSALDSPSASAASPASAPPPAKMSRAEEAATPEPERTSRSGRVIKPKKFGDDVDSKKVTHLEGV